MKTTNYNTLVSSKNSKTYADLKGIKKADVNKEIQSRHANWQADKKASANELARVYADWYQVYRKRPASERIVLQSQVDKLDKMIAYLQPVAVAGAPCQITTSDKRADEAVATKSASNGKTYFAAPIKWTVSSLEAAVKYCAKYYAGTEVSLAAKFNAIK